MLGDSNTIAAIATARGSGALSIVRISGPLTENIIQKCFQSKNFDPKESHRASFGLWTDSVSGAALDEVIVLNYAGGRGFTGEPSAEIICHGGTQVAELVLESLLAAGARLARPGEYTYRAVMNGKLDLAKAEGVLELIHAKTPRAAALALNNIRGALSEKITQIETDTVYLLANLEASIDFTTEDIQPVEFSEMLDLVRRTIEKVEALVKSTLPSRVVSQGLRVVLAGRPNGGKSSLLNGLLGRERSIVADLPGTTRDTVEDEVLIDGTLFRLVDTAGLRVPESEVERKGVERTLLELNSADVVVYVIDGSIGVNNDDAEKIQRNGRANTIICFNKIDLRAVEPKEALFPFGLHDFVAVTSSAVESEGVRELRKALISIAQMASDGEMTSFVSTQRQKESLLGARGALRRAEALLSQSASPEFVAFELKESLEHIQSLLGKNAGDDVMDRVFKEFCIGK